MNLEYLFINASEYGNIDTLRTVVRNFASTVSMTDSKKVVILDEGDALTQATQAALRGFIEEFSANCRFIITCNFKNKIIEPLHSRFSIVEFKINSKESEKLTAYFFKRVCEILKTENIKYEEKAIVEIVSRYFPDFRKTLSEVQKQSASGNITLDNTLKLAEVGFETLIEHMKVKNFTEVRKWVALNSDLDSSIIFRKIYDSMVDFVDKKSIPSLVLILAEYQYKIAFSADSEICMAACMAQIMMEVEFI